MKRILITLLAAIATTGLWAQSGEEQAARQARSVHLQHRGWNSSASVFYIEIVPEHSAPGTYFATIGFDGGYCGIQELQDGNHIAIFSVWEPSDPHDFSADPNSVSEEMRTKALYNGENVHIQRFGGEGSGGKSMMPLKWELNKPVYMAVSSGKDGDHRVAYTCWIWNPEQNDWFRMATFSTLVGSDKIGIRSPYSFVEDFRRDVKSKEVVRKARFSRLWGYDGNLWSASQEAAFTADGNTLMTIDAGPTDTGFWLATGGETTNATTKLWTTVKAGDASDESAARRLRLITVINAAATAQ